MMESAKLLRLVDNYKELLRSATRGTYGQIRFGTVHSIARSVITLLSREVGSQCSYVQELKAIDYSFTGNLPIDREFIAGADNAVHTISSVLNAVRFELETYGDISGSDDILSTRRSFSTRVFIVHGHDRKMKIDVANYIKELGLAPIVLQRQPNKSRTIIEKFEDYSDVGFAVGLLSPDDWYRKAYARNSSEKRCPRQNVILETGFFIGKLSRERVMLLVKKREKLEYPSDYDGVLYTLYDKSGEWKRALALELHHAQYAINPAYLPLND